MHATVLRALERCCICDAYFLPRDSAPKRRTHIEACARFAGLGSDEVEDLVVKAGAQALASLRAAHEVQYAKSTLFTKMGERHVPDKRLVKLSAVIGPRLEACALASAAEEHRAARVTCRAYLQRLCVNEMSYSTWTRTDAGCCFPCGAHRRSVPGKHCSRHGPSALTFSPRASPPIYPLRSC